MKLIIALAILYSNFALASKPCAEQLDEMGMRWAKKEGRSQAAGWIFFTGKGIGKSQEQSFFRAEGQALSRLAQECRLIHKFVKINERCNEGLGSEHVAYARVSVRHDNCKTSQTSDDKKWINTELSTQFSEYKEQIKNERNGDLINDKQKVIDAKIQKMSDQLNTLISTKRDSGINKQIRQKNQEINQLKKQLVQNASPCSSAKTCYKLALINYEQGEFYASARYGMDACEQYNSGAGCNLHGVVYRDKLNNPKKAKLSFEMACDKKDGGGCHNLGVYYWYRDKGNQPSWARTKGLDKPIKYLKLACKYNFGQSCGSVVGLIYSKDYAGSAKIKKELHAMLDKGCLKLKDINACISAGVSASQSTQIKDIQKAKGYLEFACHKLNSMKACSNLGSLYIWKEIKDFKKMKEYGEKACNANYYPGCTKLGLNLWIRSKDEKNAQVAFKKACKGNDGEGCGHYARYVKDRKKSSEILKKGCELKDPSSCGLYGNYLRNEKKDSRTALKYYQIGCNIGNYNYSTSSCAGVGMTNIDLYGYKKVYWEKIIKGCHNTKRSSISDATSCFYRGLVAKKYRKDKVDAKKHLSEQCKKSWVPLFKKLACKELKTL
ncbi:MAG: hypothetical protein KC478_13060 [Bacteriovoracaceae bacterium]|nr:hypothetical protein [Bacteriovoracaceae bacterium]